MERLSRFTIQAASALEYLEKKNMVHQSLWFHCMVVADYQVNSLKRATVPDEISCFHDYGLELALSLFYCIEMKF